MKLLKFLGSEAFFPYLWATAMTVTFNITATRRQEFSSLSQRIRASLFCYGTNWLIGRFCVRPTDPWLQRFLGG